MKLPTKDTLYRQHLRNCAFQLVLEGQGFTVQELAEKMGTKVTPNLRRQIRALVAEGQLLVQPYWQDRTTHGNVYLANDLGRWGIPF